MHDSKLECSYDEPCGIVETTMEGGNISCKHDSVGVVGKGKNWTLDIVLDGDGIGPYSAVKVTYGGVEHTYDVEKLKDAFIWLLKPYEIYDNPSYECMRRAREESRAELLEMRRWDVAQRLKALQLPESGSHDMLNRIARVIYPTTTGWTREACEYLRDQLVDLIGGERDAQHVCAGGAGGCVRHDVQEEVNNGISGGDCGVREVCHDSDLRDMGDCHVSKEALVTYDAIGNERYKAACALEERKPILGMTKTEIFGDLGKAVTNDPNFDPSDIDHLNLMWSTLIHLLGGERDAQRGCACSADTCNHSYEQTPFVGYDTLGNERHKAVCALRKLRDDVDNFSSYYDFTEKLLSAFKINDCCWDDGLTSLCDRLIHLLGGDQVMRYPENYDLGDESDAQNDENGDICESNHQTITDELREFKGHINAGMTPETVLALRAEINAIADRIDEQFARICEQQERVLQDTIDHMQDEIDEHKEQRRVLAGNCLDYTDECWNLYDLLRDAACEYKELHDLLESIEHDVDEGGWITLFGVNYVPVSTDYETFNDMKLIKLYYKKLKQWMGEAKSLRDNLATRVEGRDHVRQELEEYRKALNETAGKLIKADAECRMYRDLLNDEAREYVRHKEATDSMYKSFNDVFEAMERLL